jgi:hypothetical protein
MVAAGALMRTRTFVSPELIKLVATTNELVTGTSDIGNFGRSAMSQLSPLSAPERTWIILKIVESAAPDLRSQRHLLLPRASPHSDRNPMAKI